MPRVPAYERSVRLRPVHQQNMNITATADHMGAAVGRGMKSLAGGVDKVGDALHETHVQSLKDLAVQTEADEATTRFRPINSKALHDPETGVLKRTGKAAVDSRAAYEKSITAQKDAIAKELSPGARKIFNAAAMSEIATSLETVIPHSVREVKRWVNEASAASVASFIGEAALSFAVPGSLPRLAGALAQEIARNGRLNGLSEAEIGQQQQVRTSQLHTTALLEQAKSDPLGAKATFDELGETLSQEDRSHLEEKLREPVLNAQASEKGREIMGLRRRLVTAAARTPQEGTPQEGTPPSGMPAPKAFLRETYKGASRYDGIDTLDDSFAGNLAALMEDAPASMRGRIGLIKVSARPAEGERQTVDLVYNGRSLGLAPQGVRDYILANASRYNLSFPAPGPSPEAAGYGALRPVEFGSRLVARGSGLSQRATLPSAAEIDTHLASIADPALRERTRRLVSQSIHAESRAAQEREEAEARERFNAGADDLSGTKRLGRREPVSNDLLVTEFLGLAARQPDGFSGLSLPDYYDRLSGTDREELEAIQQAVMANDPSARRNLADWSDMADLAEDQLDRMGLLPAHADSLEAAHRRGLEIAAIKTGLYRTLKQERAAGTPINELAKRNMTMEAITKLVLDARLPGRGRRA
jgi:hypothetical protein